MTRNTRHTEAQGHFMMTLNSCWAHLLSDYKWRLICLESYRSVLLSETGGSRSCQRLMLPGCNPHSMFLKSRHKSTHPPPADKIPGRTRQSRRSPPVKGETRPSWISLVTTKYSCHRLFHSSPSTCLRCALVGAKGNSFLKGRLTWKACALLCKAALAPSPQSAQECLNEHNHTNRDPLMRIYPQQQQ